ncbi:uncharacterized protein LOC121636375 [Melanotaenia boesemani]|uniref:uncharacterized protein LOC121636375 n=1 Tax=Melanotaenia boesemani TaxID=1250792 RepID=UPI001C048108|nr:uncharacterized protein LOC121636375 [Melanotaenia boesemani]
MLSVAKTNIPGSSFSSKTSATCTHNLFISGQMTTELTDMDDIATLVKEALPMCSTPATLQPIIDVLQDLGVETVDDMKLVQLNDLAGVLRPIQARKLIAHVKNIFSARSDSASSCSNMEEGFTSTPCPSPIPSSSQSSFGSPGAPQTPQTETLRITSSPGIPSTSQSTFRSPVQVDNYKRSEMLGKKRIVPDDISTVPGRRSNGKTPMAVLRGNLDL